MMENNERYQEKKCDRETRTTGRASFLRDIGGSHGGGLPNCIAYAKGSLDNGDSQRAERVVIRNMG